MQSGPINGGMDGDYNGVDLVEISEIFVTQDDFCQWIGTICQGDHVHFIPNNADKLNWIMSRGGFEINNAGLVSLT